MTDKIIQNKNKFLMLTVFSVVIIFSMFMVSAFANPATVNLGEAGNFAVLSSTAISNVPTSAIIGDIGVSPAAGTALTGFTCPAVTGTVHVVSAGGDTLACQTIDPSYLTPTVLEYEAAYTDATGRTPDASISTALDGLTYTPGIYNGANLDLNNNNNVTLDCTSTGSNGVFIFQTAGHLNIGTNANVNLIGGCQPGNVFWAVAGTTDILGGTGTESTFQGTVLSGQGTTEISLGLGSTVLGRLMSDKTISLQANTITVPTAVTTGPVFIDANTNGILDSGELFFNALQPAVNAAISGDTIVVTAGTYTEIGQIVINKNLTIIGEDKATTIIKPAQDTGIGNHVDANAWILVNSGVTFNLKQVTLDGSGKLINHAILSHGHGTIDNNIISNIGYNPSGPNYAGIGIELYNSDMTVSNNQFNNIGRIGVYTGFGSVATITGNTYTGKGTGNFLDYGFEVGRNGHATISNNTISNVKGIADVDGSTSAGILVTSYFNPETPSGAIITGNTISDSSNGIIVGYDGSDTSSVVAYDNKFVGITNYGLSSTAPVVNATNNYWGTNVESEIMALISGNVDYAPWYINDTMTTVTIAPDATETIFNTTNMKVNIPSTTIVTGNSNWNGTINAPSTQPTATVRPPTTPGFTTQISKVVEVGAVGVKLTLDKAAKIVMSGETGKKVGYSYDGATFNKITTLCIDNTQATNNLLPAGEDCYFDDGTDLIIWTKHFTEFVTYSETALAPGAIDLGEAGNFVVLSKASITDVNPSVVTGDVGASPIDGASILLSCSEIAGTIWQVDDAYTGGFDTNTTCAMSGTASGGAGKTYVDTAIGDMGTAYAEATTGRTAGTGSFLNAGAGTLGIPGTSEIFVPGVYTWGTDVTIVNDIYLTGNSTDVWVFQVSGTLDISSGKQIHLTGGALAKNVFWASTGVVTLGTTSVFEGNILTSGTSQIVMLTGSTLHGRALSDGEVQLQSATITIPGNPPAAPSVTNDDNANTVTGITEGMEYNLDNSTNYTAYNSTNFSSIDFSGNHVLLVRVAAQGINPAGEVTTLTFTTNPTTSGGGSGGGGGASGGSVSGCSTQWIVSAWNTCVDGIQTRAVSYTIGQCEPTVAKPVSSQACTTSTTDTTNTATGNNAPITGGVIGALTSPLGLVIIILLALGTIGVALVVRARRV